jgi:serine/threonine protein kinase
MKVKNNKLILPDILDEEAKDLIQILLNSDPEKRIDIDQVIAHQYISSHQIPNSQVKANPTED